MTPGERPSFNFVVTIALASGRAIAKGQFSEVSGLGAGPVIGEFREGSGNRSVHQLAGGHKSALITLKRGLVDTPFYEWCRRAVAGTDSRSDGSIVLLDEQGAAAGCWKFTGGSPVGWTGPDLAATANEVAIETLQLCYEGLEVAHP